MKQTSLALLVLLIFVASASAQFGHGLLQKFVMDPKYLNLNHGSYGSVPASVLASGQAAQAEMELNPDKWFRYEIYQRMDEVRALMAQYISADPNDVVFIPNASTGVNTILRSLPNLGLKRGAKILFFNVAYQMVKNTLYYLQHTYDISLIQVNLTLPFSTHSIVQQVEAALLANPDIQLASFSHITSVPAMILPVQQLTRACQRRGVLVLIDGAHALGHIPVNVSQINADFYLTNGHKWFYSPKPSALLWVRKDRQSMIYPTVISDEGQGATTFQFHFSWEGTFDYSSYLAFPAAFQFRQQLGDTAIMQYIHNLAVKGGEILSSAWNTDTMMDSSLIGAMVNVRLPTLNQTLAASLPTRLLNQYNTFVPVYSFQNQFYVRVSAQIYNEESDFVMLAQAILNLLKA